MPGDDLDHLRTWIGRGEEASDIITPRLMAEFRATFAPHLGPVGEGEAPLALHWCLAPPIAPMAALGADGHPAKGGFLPPVSLPRRMWAGGLIETKAPLREGDVVTRRSTIGDVTQKTGRSGTLCFVALHHEYATPRGVAVSERHDIVYREAAGAAPASDGAPEPMPKPDLEWPIDGSSVLLFRYSAMTFNGHKIHYDLPYVTKTEGYDGLVIHGPVQATLLFNIAAALQGRVPIAFDYRGVAPLAGEQVFRAAALRAADGGITCWTTSAAGRVCMRGEARF